MKKSLAERMAKGEFIVSIQIDPPGIGTDIKKYWENIGSIRAEGFGVLDINSSRRSSYDSIFLASMLQRMGFETIPHVTTRDSSVDGLVNLIFPAYQESFVSHFLVITGDPREKEHSKLPMKKLARGVYQTDSVGALEVFNEHIRQKAGFRVSFAGAVNQNSFELWIEGDRVRQKERFGADFFMSQPIFNECQAQQLLDFYRAWSKKPLVIGIWPMVNAKTLDKIYQGAVEGVVLPDIEYYDMKKYVSDVGAMKERGIEKAGTLIKKLQETKKISGVYIVAPAHSPLLSLDVARKIC